MDKVNMRVIFAKKGRAVYISHLDLMHAMQRALKRSKLPVWYTEGFNPRIYLNFPLALSLGIESECEPMELAVIEDITAQEITDRLNSVLPEGLRAVECFIPKHSIKDMGFAEYDIEFADRSGRFEELADRFAAQESITVLKHSKKKGNVEVDIKPHINILGVKRSGESVHVQLRLPASLEFNLNSGIFADALIKFASDNGADIECVCTKRTNILCKDGSKFV